MIQMLRIQHAYLDLPGCFDKCDAVVIVFGHPRGNGENVGVEDDIMWTEADLLHQDTVRSGTDLDFTLRVCGLKAQEEETSGSGNNLWWACSGFSWQFRRHKADPILCRPIYLISKYHR